MTTKLPHAAYSTTHCFALGQLHGCGLSQAQDFRANRRPKRYLEAARHQTAKLERDEDFNITNPQAVGRRVTYPRVTMLAAKRLCAVGKLGKTF